MNILYFLLCSARLCNAKIYQWQRLQRLLGLEDDERAFYKIKCVVRSEELRRFTVKPHKDGDKELLDLIVAELKGREPIVFGGSHGDRCLSFISGLISNIYGRRRSRHRMLMRHKVETSESALPTTQTSDREPRTAALSTSFSLPVISAKTSIYHSPRRTKVTRKNMRPVVLLTRRKKLKNPATRKNSHDYGTLPQHRPTSFDFGGSDDCMEFNAREPSRAQYFAESERSASSSLPADFWGTYSGFEEATQGTVSTLQTSKEENMARPSTLRSVYRAVPQVKGRSRMPGPLSAPAHSHDFQPDNRPAKSLVPGTAHERQYSAFSGSQSTHYSRLTSDDYLDYINTSSLHGPRWERREPDPNLPGDFSKKEKFEKPVTDAPNPSYAYPPSKGTDPLFITKASTQRESGIAGIHRFLSKCHPPMMQHILRFVEFGCTTTEYLRGVSTWPAEQRHKLLVKILQAGRGGAVPQMDIAVLENQFETYFGDDDV
ncbi:hypothetical protein HYPSUDRAFT_71041 [Hypholoma sublateritium FD-334 SS-4]|uniref:Uncharacterized protein n=1 Tax=Hypholoma sublateritium (strain FD-334 SS-4) TaxID=945553 RepID=A0A0D2NJV6_HYPSF|nr:hypothetical protein HYPSUDRAFT_71041 [Hypholoma sublateritium FD-334 SS-4]